MAVTLINVFSVPVGRKMNSSRGGMTQLRSEIQPAGVSESQASRPHTLFPGR